MSTEDHQGRSKTQLRSAIVPRLFFFDHQDRAPASESGCGIARVVRSFGQRVEIEGTADQLAALRSDAEFYADPANHDADKSLVQSARRTVEALTRVGA